MFAASTLPEARRVQLSDKFEDVFTVAAYSTFCFVSVKVPLPTAVILTGLNINPFTALSDADCVGCKLNELVVTDPTK